MKTVLVIDDNPSVGLTLQLMLESLGHKAVVVTSAKEGLARIHGGAEAYALIITDVMMPDMDGIEMVNLLRREGNKVPIVAISGGGTRISSTDALSIAETLVDAVLRKPFSSDELDAVLHKFLAC